jgi:hypothetical protein
MSEPLLFELQLEASADVVRGCCGGNHEFGECPLDTNEETDHGTS